MASFQDMMRQWIRMCAVYSAEDKCNDCPLARNPVCGELHYVEKHHIENAEREIMDWSAANPEPVYPTWQEWLMGQGILSAGGLYSKAFRPIPADIAEKLGIEPKEG